jgi:hypothetical protein
MRIEIKVARLVALIKQRLGIDAVLKPVLVDGKKVAERGGNWLTRSFGAGYPDLDAVIEQLAKQ